MVHKMQFSEDSGFNKAEARLLRRNTQAKHLASKRKIKGTEMEKQRKYLLTVTLKTEYAVLLCADVERIAINGKGDCGMR